MASWYEAATLPKFRTPPVNETAMGFEFPALSDVGPIRLVQLQGQWAAEYPTLGEQGATPPSSLAPVLIAQPPTFQVFQVPPIKVFAYGANERAGLVLQSQADRFFLNWVKGNAEGPYPGFDRLRPEFESQWERYSHFFGQVPQPIVAEFTYVNPVNIEQGETLESVFTVFSTPSEEMPGVPRVSRFQYEREVEPSVDSDWAARITITGEPAMGPAGLFIAVTVSTKVILSFGMQDPLAVIDAAHVLSSRTFASMTSTANHEEWGQY